MAIKLSDLVIMSDVDGTLLTRDMVIPQRNIEAVRRFVDGGGHFGLATGRSVTYTDMITAHIPVNYPCVFSNGGVLIDIESGESLMDLYLPDGTEDCILELTERFPELGVVVLNRENYFNVRDEQPANGRNGYNNPNIRHAELAALPGPWYKVLYLVREERRDEFFAYVEQRRFPGVRFVSTNEYMHEMLPAESSKGNALRKLMELRGLERERLVCIGDFYNDREMIELAGIGATLCTSPQDLQDLAQIIVCGVEDGALADLIEQLEARFER